MRDFLSKLDLKEEGDRLTALSEIFREREKTGSLPERTEEVNNHVHTRYSFSPYYPAQAAFMAWDSGLKTVGIMDHDSLAGAAEMIEACKILGIYSTVGFEIRVNAINTGLEGRKINNPDSENILYMAAHGIAPRYFDQADDFLKPVRLERAKRNARQTDRLNRILSGRDLPKLDFENDVLGNSLVHKGGTVTERHILAALADKLIGIWGRGRDLVNNLDSQLSISPQGRLKDLLSDPENPYLVYDLLGVLKSYLLPSFFIQPGYEECVNVRIAADFIRQINAIPAYAYLGDVADSPTGDKVAEKFEDSYLDLLFKEINGLGFEAVTYMPPRNTARQLKRLRELCRKYGMMEISGVDINSARQSFNCPKILEPDFKSLIDSAWALIAHEKLSDLDPAFGLFSDENSLAKAPLSERTAIYAEYGKTINPETLLIEEVPGFRSEAC